MQTGKYINMLKWVPAVIILAGIVLRLYLYLGDRGLWTDEVAVALNIAERNFTELAQPLLYKQYAPPVFLWMVKLLALVFGFGERALRLLPFLTGVGAVFVFYKVLCRHMHSRAAWYPLLLFATGVFYVRYSVELKQYMPDAFIALGLIWLAGYVDINKAGRKQFVLVWSIAGSIAIWSSMPSVFVLAGIACYYSARSIAAKNYQGFAGIVLVALLWMTQFVVYYFTILKSQAQSDYLVSYHNAYFLNGHYTRDKEVLKNIFREAFGGGTWLYKVNSVLAFAGIVVLVIRRKYNALLLLLPVALLFVAAFLKQYSLIPRLALFAMPFMLICIGVAVDVLMKRFMPALISTIALLLLFAVDNSIADVFKPWHREDMREALMGLSGDFSGNEIYVYTGAIESYRYYTEVHPERNRWNKLSGAQFITEGASLDSLTVGLPPRFTLLYTIPFDSYNTKTVLERYATLEETREGEGYSVFVFNKKG